MKLLSVTIPCYNSEAYIDRCVSSLLPAGSQIEIILVNDGSTDRTPEIIDGYVSRYPTIVKAVHKENGGHGSAVNAGIDAASGEFFKVVDSDDRLDPAEFIRTLAFLKEQSQKYSQLDMLLTNYVYDKVGKKNKFVMKPSGLKENVLLEWKDVHNIWKYHFILMHSIIYRTELLRRCGLRLPEHTFYVDNIYAFQPLPNVRTFMYRNVDLYWYFIGRADQSVNEANIVRRIDQYIRVTKIMASQYKDSKSITSDQACLNYMLNYFEIIFAITCNFLNVGNTEENVRKKEQLWKDLAEIDADLEKKMRRRATLIITNLPGKAGRDFCNKFYHIGKNFLGTN